MNPYQYLSPRAEELPKDFVDDILDILNTKMETIKRFRRKKIDPSYQEEELKIILRFLDLLDLHACYSIVGHRGEYCFPSLEDCEFWQDWIWQCMDAAD